MTVQIYKCYAPTLSKRSKKSSKPSLKCFRNFIEKEQIYLLWIGSNSEVPANLRHNFHKACRLESSKVSFFNLSLPPNELVVSLKPIVPVCFESCRSFYRKLTEKYRTRSTSAAFSARFMQSWMQQIYYNTKSAITEELKGDFEAALKFYHSILARFKQMIEDTSVEPERKIQIVNYLRFSSDICFLRVSLKFYKTFLLIFSIAFISPFSFETAH